MAEYYLSPTLINNKEKSRNKSGNKTTRQKLIQISSIILIALVLFFLIVLIKAYFEGKFDSVAALQEYIGGFGVFGPFF